MQLVLAVSHWTARKRPHVIDGHEAYRASLTIA